MSSAVNKQQQRTVKPVTQIAAQLRAGFASPCAGRYIWSSMGIIDKLSKIFKSNTLDTNLVVDCDSVKIALLPSDVVGFADQIRSRNIDLKKLATSDPFKSEVCIIKPENSSIDKILSLFQSLPIGEPNRCFVPSYRIEFLKGDVITKVAVICWRGNQIKILDGNNTSGYCFNGEANESIELLDILRKQVAIQI